jgi:hypothetical protein
MSGKLLTSRVSQQAGLAPASDWMAECQPGENYQFRVERITEAVEVLPAGKILAFHVSH